MNAPRKIPRATVRKVTSKRTKRVKSKTSIDSKLMKIKPEIVLDGLSFQMGLVKQFRSLMMVMILHSHSLEVNMMENLGLDVSIFFTIL